MLAYAASRPASVERRPHPNFMLAIIAVHVAVVAAVMSAKMDLPTVIKHPPIDIFWVKPPANPPPPNPAPAHPTSQPRTQSESIDRLDPIVTTPPQALDTGGAKPNPAQVVPLATGSIELPPAHSIVKLGPRLLTPESELKPPYPASKLLTEEEAVLRLRLTIDSNGRVVGVDPVGNADRAFLEAARRHLIAHWRYRPASEDGRAIASSMVITLRFQLDG